MSDLEYAITLQRTIEALANGTELPDAEHSPHVIRLAYMVRARLISLGADAEQLRAELQAARDGFNGYLNEARAQARREALEEAARIVETAQGVADRNNMSRPSTYLDSINGDSIAAAIRALGDR